MANLKLNSFYFLGVILCCISWVVVAAMPAGNETDRLALLAFKDRITHDPYRFMSSWNNSLHHCLWDGVECDKDSGRVFSLELNGDLGGTIAPHIGNMTFLSAIGLSHNSFTGKIPQEIGRLFHLVYLSLYDNAFTGEILQELGSLHLPKLEVLDLSHNALEGKIPSNLSAAFPSLFNIDLSFNNLKGEIPRNLSHFSELQSIYLSNNQLSGTIPQNLSRLSFLRILDLSSNKLTGRIPNWDDHLISATLKYLALHNNSLEGEIPINFFNHPFNLNYIDLAHNELTGEIPPLICNASLLLFMDLSHNNLAGILPRCIANFSKQLSNLNLGTNNFHGNIPDSFIDGNSLWSLELQGNNLDGNLPQSLVNCRQLQVLNLGHNKISDLFPIWLEILPSLNVLILRSNKLHGELGHPKHKISFPELRVLDLSFNSFIGQLPLEYFTRFMGMMSVREKMDEPEYMSSSQYYESLSAQYYDSFTSMTLTIKGQDTQFDKILTIFAAIDLSSNRFTGEIPVVIGNLVAIKSLNLSHNNLVGYIPTSLGNLGALESLDLSANNLVGQIPPQLAYLTFLEVLNLSYNHLAGRIPQGKQFSTFENSSFVGNSRLCGLPLSNSCRGDKVPKPLPPPSPQEDGSNFMDKLGWKVVIMGYTCGLPFGLFIGYLMFTTQKPKWLVAIIEEEMHAMAARRRARKHGRRF